LVGQNGDRNTLFSGMTAALKITGQGWKDGGRGRVAQKKKLRGRGEKKRGCQGGEAIVGVRPDVNGIQKSYLGRNGLGKPGEKGKKQTAKDDEKRQLDCQVTVGGRKVAMIGD